MKTKDNRTYFYNSLVECYYKTGQGFPGKIMRAHGEEPIIEELLEEKLVKSIIDFHGDEWICLTKGYCAEESFCYPKKDMDVLTFIRIYRKCKDPAQTGETTEELFQDKAFKKKYTNWTSKNKKKLEEKIRPIRSKSIIKDLIKIEKKFIKELECYNSNVSIKDFQARIGKLLSLEGERLSITMQILDILKNQPYDKKTIEENTLIKKESEQKITILKSIDFWLKKQKPSSKIKNLVK